MIKRVALSWALAVLLVVSAGAMATGASATKYVDSVFGNPDFDGTSGAGGRFGQLSVAGVAVNESGTGGADAGDIYVVDRLKNRVQQFDSAGRFVRAWGRDVVTAGEPNDVSASAFEVCDTTTDPANDPADCKDGIAGTLGGEMDSPYGIVVSQATGDVYVTDGANFRVQQFSAVGAFVRAFGADVATPAGGGGLEVCASAPVCKVGVSGGVGGAFGPAFVGNPAIVPQGPPNAGNVLVADPGNRRVQEFTPIGGFVRAIGADVESPAGGSALEVCAAAGNCKTGAAGGSAIGQFANSEPKRVAADDAGAIYAVEVTTNFRVQKFSPQDSPPGLVASPFAVADLTAGAVDGSTGPQEIAFDDATSRVLVARGYISVHTPQAPMFDQCTGPVFLVERRILEFDREGALRDTHGACAGVGALGQAPTAGFAVSGVSGVIVTGSVFSAGQVADRVFIFDTDGITPARATVDAAANITTSAADLSGTVDPNSVDNSFAPTVWTLQVSANGTQWTAVATGSVGDGSFPDPSAPYVVIGSADGLRPNTLYRVRVVTVKPFANPQVASPEATFLTDAVPAEIRTTALQSVDVTTATISARINAHSTPTTYRFEYGKLGSFTNVVPTPDAAIGSGPDFVLASESLSGLTPGTTYQYRAIATSATEGVTVGPTKTFTTFAQSVATGTAGRAYELVSPADKLGGTGVGTWYQGPAAHAISGTAAYEGDRFLSRGFYGAVLMDSPYSYGGDMTLGERTATGWRNQSVINRRGGYGQAEHFKIPSLVAGSDDLGLMGFSTNNSVLRLFPEQADWGSATEGVNLREWVSGKWEIVGPTDPSVQDAATDVEGAIDQTVVAAGGGYAALSGAMRGLAGPGDPTRHTWPDLSCTAGPPASICHYSVYLDDVTAGLSDTWPGAGVRSLANVCTGTTGLRTQIPAVDGVGDLTSASCPAPAGPNERLISSRGASFPAGRPDVISADGSRLFFVSPDSVSSSNAACSGSGAAGTACPAQLYVRQRQPDGSVVTRWISRSRSTSAGAASGAYGGPMIAGQDASLTSAVVFEGASRDGDKVFFRTASPLTPDDPNSGGTCSLPCTSGDPSPTSIDLYMYDFPDVPGADPADGTLTRISGGPTAESDANVSSGSTSPGGANPAGSGGALRLAAGNGSKAYFVTAAPLDDVPGTGNGAIVGPSGTVGQSQMKNLYLYDSTKPLADRWRFIARLPATTPLGGCATTLTTTYGSALSSGSGIGKDIVASLSNCWRATDDGAFVTFVTDGRMTADDPDTITGDVYAYDATTDELIRISAPQGGVGGTYECITGAPDAGVRCHADAGVNLTSTHGLASVVSAAPDGNRTMFFESRARLVAEDHNDVYDVYQWHNGKLSLISTGAAGADDVLYRGNDRTGRNVYISTRDRLSWQDFDSVLDTYTARVGGGFPEPPAPPAVCGLVGDVCQAPGPGTVTTPAPQTDVGRGPGAAPAPRRTLSVSSMSRSAQRSAARKGRLTLQVRSNRGGPVVVRVTGRISKRTKQVGRETVNLDGAGAKALIVELSATARKVLKSGKSLRLRVLISADGARERSMSIVLRRAAR